MAARQKNSVKEALAFISSHGLLLEADALFPSLVALIVGAPVKGSWWGHPLGTVIYNTANALVDDSDVIAVKLVADKVTFIHRALWPSLAAIGAAREPWQVEGLSPESKLLLKAVDRAGVIRTDAMSAAMKRSLGKPGPATGELEKRLVINTEQFHADDGAHYKELRTWKHWAQTRNVLTMTDVNAAKDTFETAVAALNSTFGADARLPWQKRKKGARAAKR